MASLDAELWLFFEKEIKIDGSPIFLRLKSVNADSTMETLDKNFYVSTNLIYTKSCIIIIMITC